MTKLLPILLFPALISASPAGARARQDETSALRAGAASVDITPPESAFANGIANSGYNYSNEAGSHLTFQVISSRLKPGCAEDKIVSTFLELISEVRR